MASTAVPATAPLTSGGRRTARAVTRFLARVLVTAGILLIADAALTVLWQEPISALLALRQQSALEQSLGLPDDERAPKPPLPPAELERRAVALRHRAKLGQAIGKISMPTLKRKYVMVQGTGLDQLRLGPAHYVDTPLPGEHGTVGIAGHRTTYLAPFNKIDLLKKGDRIVVTMPYGRFFYRVEGSRIVKPTDVWVKRPVGHDRIVMSACHPKYSAAQRIVVWSRFDHVEGV